MFDWKIHLIITCFSSISSVWVKEANLSHSKKAGERDRIPLSARQLAICLPRIKTSGSK